MRIYVGMMDGCWSLTEAQWRKLLETGAADIGFDLDELGARELRRRPAGVVKFDRDSAQRTSIYRDVLYYEPLDWEPDQFAYELAALDETLAAARGEPETEGAAGGAGHEARSAE